MPDPEGLLFHAGVGEDDDFFTVSVWESREADDAFASRFKEAPKVLREERPRFSRCTTRLTKGFPPNPIRVQRGRAASRTPRRFPQPSLGRLATGV
jgi:hypothetical protein